MIPTYQIHNVLRAFTKNLVHNDHRWQPPQTDMMIYSEGTGASAEGKRQAVLKRITASIVDEIASMGSRDECLFETVSGGRQETSCPEGKEVPVEEGTRFVYRAIDGDGQKETRVCYV